MKSISESSANQGHPMPTREQIAIAAFHLFVENGSRHGHDLDDWLRAETLLVQKAKEVEDGQASKPKRIAVDGDLEMPPASSSEYSITRESLAGRKSMRQAPVQQGRRPRSPSPQWNAKRSARAKSAA